MADGFGTSWTRAVWHRYDCTPTVIVLESSSDVKHDGLLIKQAADENLRKYKHEAPASESRTDLLALRAGMRIYLPLTDRRTESRSLDAVADQGQY